jgi:hypothetical protein
MGLCKERERQMKLSKYQKKRRKRMGHMKVPKY